MALPWRHKGKRLPHHMACALSSEATAAEHRLRHLRQAKALACWTCRALQPQWQPKRPLADPSRPGLAYAGARVVVHP